MNHFKKYHESIRPPISIRIVISIACGFVFLIGLIWIMYPNTKSLPAFFPSLLFVLVVGSIAFLILSMFYKVSIRVSKKLLAASGEKEFILRVSGTKKDGASYIRCKNIKAMEVCSYEVSGFASINPFFSRKGDKGEQVVLLPGYNGEGLLLSYSYEAFFSQEKKDHKILFPTKNAQYLIQILKNIIESDELK